MLIIAALIIGGYTNHAGNVVSGWPVKLTSTQVTLAERAPSSQLPTIPPFHIGCGEFDPSEPITGMLLFVR